MLESRSLPPGERGLQAPRKTRRQARARAPRTAMLREDTASATQAGGLGLPAVILRPV